MVDIGHAQTSNPLTGAKKQKLGSDAGTILLHWLTALAMVVSILTGLRISADGLRVYWAALLAPVLPQGEMWTWHILAGLTLLFSAVVYSIYVHRGSLLARNSSARLKTLRPPTNQRLRLRAINVALHWFAYGAIAALSITGIALYLGYASLFLTLHNLLAWAMLAYIAIHTLAHFLYGGIAQLLRLFRPRELEQSQSNRLWPLGVALLAAIVAIGTLTLIDWASRSTIKASLAVEAPVLDGKLDDPAWQNASEASIATHQGANLRGTGTSNVKVRSVIHGERIYFAFRWQDPTRSLMRAPLVKKDDGWHVMGTGLAQADVNDFYEDKFAVLFSANDGLGGGESTFLGKDPLANHPKSPHGRGLHYTQDGRIMDLWQWKASRGGMLGHVDDMHFGPPKQPSKAEASGKKRYAAGYAADPGRSIYEYNYIANGPKGYASPVQVKRLPNSPSDTQIRMGKIPEGSDGHNETGSIWWLTRSTSTPFSDAINAKLPVGTIIPSTLNIHRYEGDRADLAGGAQWRDGHWSLEVSRKLETASPYDIAFRSGQTIFVWLSVFDHNQTRHTRHQRPITLNIP